MYNFLGGYIIQLMQREDPIAKHFRITSVQLSALRKLGLATIGDLLYHFPQRYEHLGQETETERLSPGAKVTLYGSLRNLKAKKLWKSKRPATEGWFEDATGSVKCIWFNQPYISNYVKDGSYVKLSGTVGGTEKSSYIANPKVEIIPAGSMPVGLFEKTEGIKIQTSDLFPVYSESHGITSRWFYHALKRVFENGVHKKIIDPIPPEIRKRYSLPEIGSAFVWIHAPEEKSHAEAARKRFSFEEIFAIQIARAKERALNDKEPSFPIPEAEALAEKFLSSLQISPTFAQRRAISDILKDLDPSEGKPHPMARLLEGDVGSGKTLVAAASAYAVVNSRPPGRKSGTLQVAYMAPTEILATQHFLSFIEYFRELPINIALITGSACKKFPSKSVRGKATDISRAQLLKWVANGEIAMVVGTHALIQKKVRFQHLAFAIVDEQHRFGTAQRRAFAKKGDLPAGRQAPTPHFLSMTATPIPRTLALTIYGDLDISVLDELPPGRARVATRIIKKEERKEAYDAVRSELLKGRQAYVICPRIEEPDPKKWNALQAKSAKAEAKRLQVEVFPEFKVGLLHGAMSTKEKDDAMLQFANGQIHVLVATSVVEVGINVPNATAMLIEGAERFGLAQLHQLRGRIQRSAHSPYCFLLPETSGEAARKRLRALEKSDDGFKLAEADLEARGAGDLFGRRQWGVSDVGMEALKNPRLIAAARAEAIELIKKDPELQHHPELASRAHTISKELHIE